MMEVWSPVVGYEDYYEVSDLGALRSIKRTISYVRNGISEKADKQGKSLKLCRVSSGYLAVSLCKNNRKYTALIHRVVARAFLGNVSGAKEVNHINGVKSDNRVENLEWVTSSQNQRHAISMGLYQTPKGESHYGAKLTVCDVVAIKEALAENRTLASIATQHGVHKVTIHNIKSGVTWKHVDKFGVAAE